MSVCMNSPSIHIHVSDRRSDPLLDGRIKASPRVSLVCERSRRHSSTTGEMGDKRPRARPKVPHQCSTPVYHSSVPQQCTTAVFTTAVFTTQQARRGQSIRLAWPSESCCAKAIIESFLSMPFLALCQGSAIKNNPVSTEAFSSALLVTAFLAKYFKIPRTPVTTAAT